MRGCVIAILVQFQHRLDTAANWTSANPVLLAGELGLDTTNSRLKIGDGTTAWNSLAYLSTRVLSGSGAPSGGTGVDGDYYIASSTTTLYGPKAAGSWPGGVVLIGTNGWSPTFASVSNGSGGFVLQITGWTGGTGTPPSSTNQFIGSSGIVSTAAAAQDIRGPQGATGSPGTSPNAFLTVTGNSGTATADTTSDSLAITGTGQASTTATDTPDGLVVAVPLLSGDISSVAGGVTTLPGIGTPAGTFGDATHIPIVTTNAKGQVTGISSTTFTAGGNAFGIVTGNSGTANSDATGDTLAITGTGSITTAATDTPDGLVITQAAATFSAAGNESAAGHIALNSLDGRTSAGATPRVFRPGDFMVGNTYDPTGSADSSTSFQAMMTAVAAHNDRCMIMLTPGVFKIAPGIIKNFGTNNPSVPIRGPGRGTCVLLPTGAGDMITFNRNTTGGDSVACSGFTIYNTSGTPYTSGAGILTNGADAIDISEIAFIDLFNDIQVSGQPYSMVTNGTTAVTGISPAVSAADNGQVISGPGIVPGTTFTFATSTTGTLSVAATVSTTATRFLGNTIKCSIQKMVSFNTNGNGSGCGIVVNNGQAGDTYMGPDIVMSDGGGTTRRRSCIEIIESGHYEVTQANLTGSQCGLLLDPGASQSVGFGFHTNVLCDSNTINGMQVTAALASSTIKNIKSVNSWYSGTTVVNGSAAGAGVITSGAGVLNGFTHSNDRFLNNRTHGYQHGFGTDFRWVDCDMKGNSSAGSAISDGLNVAANIGNWSINGGKYGGTDTIPGAGNQRYGISVAAGTGDNIKISPDDLTGNVTGPLSMLATGLNVFINGCPGLPAPYTRSTSLTGLVGTTTLTSMLLQKNSLRAGSTFRLTAWYQQSSTGVATFTARCGATNDALGGSPSNAVIVTGLSLGAVANCWGRAEFMMTVTAIGASGNIQGMAIIQQGVASATTWTVRGTDTAARASGAGFLAVDFTADRYLTLVGGTSVGTISIYNATIEIVSY